MNLSNLSNWVNVIAFAVWPIVAFVGRKAYQHLTSVEKELKNNGGSSIKDSIDRIEEALLELKADTKKNRKAVKKLKGELAAHLADIGE